MIYFFVLFLSLFTLFKFFKIKILVLLCLELALVSLICLNLIFSYSSKSMGSFFCGLIFLTFMVIDSVLGLSLLISSSRNSSLYSNVVFLS